MIENPISYLPHGPEIIAIKEILSLEQNSIRCVVLAKGSLVNVVEYIAQSAAVGRISNAKKQGPKLGMIIRIKEFEILSQDSELCEVVECNWSDSIANVYQVEGRAYSREGKLLAQLVMTMMEQQ